MDGWVVRQYVSGLMQDIVLVVYEWGVVCDVRVLVWWVMDERAGNFEGFVAFWSGILLIGWFKCGVVGWVGEQVEADVL
eukprot:7620867-Ditylum_brightwellii.AAC.1